MDDVGLQTAEVYKTKQQITYYVKDKKRRVLPAGRYLVKTADGRWRLTNARPPIWVSIPADQIGHLEPTGRMTDEENDWYDTN